MPVCMRADCLAAPLTEGAQVPLGPEFGESATCRSVTRSKVNTR